MQLVRGFLLLLFLHQQFVTEGPLNPPNIIPILPANSSDPQVFGVSISLCSGYLAVGDVDAGPLNEGAASIFKHEENSVTEIQVLKGIDEDFMNFGFSVAISSEFLFVGDPVFDGVNGGVYFYEKAMNSSWMFRDRMTLFASGHPWFGYSVSLFDDIVVVGDPMFISPGKAFVYEIVNSTTVLKQELMANQFSLVPDLFGVSLSIFRTTISVATPESLDSGEIVVIFDRDESSWIETGKFGVNGVEVSGVMEVDIYGNTVAFCLENPPLMLIFQKNDAGVWVQVFQVENEASGRCAVAVSCRTVVYHGPDFDNAVGVYQETELGLPWVNTDNLTLPVFGPSFGFALDVFESSVVVTDPNLNDGIAYLFQDAIPTVNSTSCLLSQLSVDGQSPASLNATDFNFTVVTSENPVTVIAQTVDCAAHIVINGKEEGQFFLEVEIELIENVTEINIIVFSDFENCSYPTTVILGVPVVFDEFLTVQCTVLGRSLTEWKSLSLYFLQFSEEVSSSLEVPIYRVIVISVEESRGDLITIFNFTGDTNIQPNVSVLFEEFVDQLNDADSPLRQRDIGKDISSLSVVCLEGNLPECGVQSDDQTFIIVMTIVAVILFCAFVGMVGLNVISRRRNPEDNDTTSNSTSEESDESESDSNEFEGGGRAEDKPTVTDQPEIVFT